MKYNQKAVDEVFCADELPGWEQNPEERMRAIALENFGKRRTNHQKINPYEHDLNEKDWLGQY